MDRVDRDGDALMYSIMWRIMPLMVALMMLSVIDRSNVCLLYTSDAADE